MALADVLRLEEVQEGAASVLILHDTQREAKDPPWIDLDVARSLEDRQAGRLFVPRPQMNRLALIIQLTVLVLLVVGGTYFYLKSTREPIEEEIPELTRYERIIAVVGEDGFSHEAPLPPLRVAVARTGRLLLVSNLSDVPWSLVDVEINPPEGYRFVREGLLNPGQTAQLPLRDFVQGETPLDAEEETLRRIRVSVPGYRVWEDRF